MKYAVQLFRNGFTVGRSVMNDQEQAQQLVQTWRASGEEFTAIVEEMGETEQAHIGPIPTDEYLTQG